MRRHRPLADSYPLQPRPHNRPSSDDADAKASFGKEWRPEQHRGGGGGGERSHDMTSLSNPGNSRVTAGGNTSPRPRQPRAEEANPLPPRHDTGSASLRLPKGSSSRPFYDEGSVLDPPPLPSARVISAPLRQPQASPSLTGHWGRMGVRPAVAAPADHQGRRIASQRRPQLGGSPERRRPTQYVLRQLPAATHVVPLEATGPSRSPPFPRGQHQPPFRVGSAEGRWGDGSARGLGASLPSTERPSSGSDAMSAAAATAGDSPHRAKARASSGGRAEGRGADDGFMTPPAATGDRRPGVQAYFTRSEVLSLHGAGGAVPSHCARGGAERERGRRSERSTAAAAAATSSTVGDSSVFWGFERAIGNAALSSSASSFSSATSSSERCAHPYNVRGGNRVLRSVLAMRSAPAANANALGGPFAPSKKRRAHVSRRHHRHHHHHRCTCSEPEAVANAAAPSKPTDPSPAATADSASVQFVAGLIHSIVQANAGGSADAGKRSRSKSGRGEGAERQAPAQGPCSTLISNAGDPLVLNVVLDYLKKKAARLEGENEELWDYLCRKEPATASPARRGLATGGRRRRRRGALAGSPASAGAAASDAGSSASSGGTSISSISVVTDSERGRRKRGKDHRIKKPRPTRVEQQTAVATASSPVGRGKPLRDRSSLSTTPPQKPYGPTERTANGTVFISPSLSPSSTSSATAAAEDRRRTSQPALAIVSPRRLLSPSESVRLQQRQRYSAEKDELYRFIRGLEEEEEAAIRAGRGSDYGFDDDPPGHDHGHGHGQGSLGDGNHSRHHDQSLRANTSLDDSARRSNSVAHSRFAVPPIASDQHDASTNAATHARCLGASAVSRASNDSVSGRQHGKHVQTSGGGVWQDDISSLDDADKLTEAESEYVNRWRRGEDARRVPSSHRSPRHTQNTTAASQTPASHDHDLAAGSVYNESVNRGGGGSSGGGRATVVTLHTHREYTRRTVRRLRAYVDQLESTRQQLREVIRREESVLGDAAQVATPTTATATHNSSGVYGVPPLYPHRCHLPSVSGRPSPPTPGGRRSNARTRGGNYFRTAYEDAEVDATLCDIDGIDPIDVKIVVKDDGIGSVSKQVIVEDSAYGFPPSSRPPSLERPTPRASGGPPSTPPSILPGAVHSQGESPVPRRHEHLCGESPNTGGEVLPLGNQQGVSSDSKQTDRGADGSGSVSTRTAHGSEVSPPVCAPQATTAPARAATAPTPTEEDARQPRTPERRRAARDDRANASSERPLSPLTRQNLSRFQTLSTSRRTTDARSNANANAASNASLEAFLDEAVAHQQDGVVKRRESANALPVPLGSTSNSNSNSVSNGGRNTSGVSADTGASSSSRPPLAASNVTASVVPGQCIATPSLSAAHTVAAVPSGGGGGVASCPLLSASQPGSSSSPTVVLGRFAVPGVGRGNGESSRRQGRGVQAVSSASSSATPPSLPPLPHDAPAHAAGGAEGVRCLDGLIVTPNTATIAGGLNSSGAPPPFSREALTSSSSQLTQSFPIPSSVPPRHPPPGVIDIEREDDAELHGGHLWRGAVDGHDSNAVGASGDTAASIGSHRNSEVAQPNANSDSSSTPADLPAVLRTQPSFSQASAGPPSSEAVGVADHAHRQSASRLSSPSPSPSSPRQVVATRSITSPPANDSTEGEDSRRFYSALSPSPGSDDGVHE